jgi:hypothetical protein
MTLPDIKLLVDTSPFSILSVLAAWSLANPVKLIPESDETDAECNKLLLASKSFIGLSR